ncbi:hypothetical protein ACJRO7_031303 [Eucalyptus globulus]|uniref:F-box domain-containing protein n=1 Tax=Eucalyptus globulus TaxID=34317 RepID=A0ABD3JIN7_EUCGL
MTQEPDRISQLPRHITDKILSRLPIREVVRTSILSRQWRTDVPGLPSQNLVKIVEEVLLLHTGPIQAFVLNHKGFFATRNIDRWILHLPWVSIKQIALYTHKRQNYKIPIYFFNCQDLTVLKLCGCSVKMPPSFEGFKKLYTSYLDRVEVSPCGPEVLVCRCPPLKCLTLKDLKGITRVNLEAARKLESLDIGGAFLDVVIDFHRGSGNANSSNLHKFFQNIHSIQILDVKNYSLRYLALGNVPHTLSHALVNLKYLSTCIDFNRKEHIFTVMCLTRSSPQLKKLKSNRPKNQETTWIRTMADFWKVYHSCCLERVQVLSMGNNNGTELELELMKFLFTSLRNLQKMKIWVGVKSVEVKDKLGKELLPFCRASEQASDHSLTRRSGTQPTKIGSRGIRSHCNCFTAVRGT